MLSKRGILAFVCAGLMSMAMIGPAAADTSGDVTVGGTLPTYLSLTVGNASVNFGTLALGTCNGATTNSSVTVVSNASWTVTTQATGTANAPLVTQLFWARANANPTCGGSTPAGTAFTGGVDSFWTGVANGPGGNNTAVHYSLQLLPYEANGGQGFSYTVTYSATN